MKPGPAAALCREQIHGQGKQSPSASVSPIPVLNSSLSVAGCPPAPGTKGLLPTGISQGRGTRSLGASAAQHGACWRVLVVGCSREDAHGGMLAAGCSPRCGSSCLPSHLCHPLSHGLTLQKVPETQALSTKRLHPSPEFCSGPSQGLQSGPGMMGPYPPAACFLHKRRAKAAVQERGSKVRAGTVSPGTPSLCLLQSKRC